SRSIDANEVRAAARVGVAEPHVSQSVEDGEARRRDGRRDPGDRRYAAEVAGDAYDHRASAAVAKPQRSRVVDRGKSGARDPRVERRQARLTCQIAVDAHNE